MEEEEIGQVNDDEASADQILWRDFVIRWKGGPVDVDLKDTVKGESKEEHDGSKSWVLEQKVKGKTST